MLMFVTSDELQHVASANSRLHEHVSQVISFFTRGGKTQEGTKMLAHLQSLVNKIKSKYLFVAENVIPESELSETDRRSIVKAFPLLPDEDFELLYSNNGE